MIAIVVVGLVLWGFGALAAGEFLGVLFDDDGAPWITVLARILPFPLAFWIPAGILIILRVFKLRRIAVVVAAMCALAGLATCWFAPSTVETARRLA